MMPRSVCMRATVLGVVAAAVLGFSPRPARGDSDWRARQNAALAEIGKPPVPSGGDAGDAVNALLLAGWRHANAGAPARCSDAVFARRVYLDLVGLLPPVDVLARFERDAAPDKRSRLVDALLADKQAYAEHWMSFWNDLLRNDEQTNIDGGRKPITTWLFASLRDNLPYDVLVASLLNPSKGGPDGFLHGLRWRGVTNASQSVEMQAAQNLAQVFLASPVKCSSCHDSFIDDKTLEDAWGLASFFSATNLMMFHCDKTTEFVQPPKYLYADLGSVSPRADLPTRRRRVAELTTMPKNPVFAKTVVNRMWQRLLGWGLFEPLDTYKANRVKDRALLTWLADDFMRSGYDLKHLLRTVARSRVYQAPPIGDVKTNTTDLPAGPVRRRMTAEQILDGVATVTGHWPKAAAMKVDVDNDQFRAWRQKVPDALAAALGRSAREQPITRRQDDATILAALEAVNGTVLADRLENGAEALLASPLGKERDADVVVGALFRRALSRPPAPPETALLAPLLGAPDDQPAARRAGWEDVLWMIFMHAEFQFID